MEFFRINLQNSFNTFGAATAANGNFPPKNADSPPVSLSLRTKNGYALTEAECNLSAAGLVITSAPNATTPTLFAFNRGFVFPPATSGAVKRKYHARFILTAVPAFSSNTPIFNVKCRDSQGYEIPIFFFSASNGNIILQCGRLQDPSAFGSNGTTTGIITPANVPHVLIGVPLYVEITVEDNTTAGHVDVTAFLTNDSDHATKLLSVVSSNVLTGNYMGGGVGMLTGSPLITYLEAWGETVDAPSYSVSTMPSYQTQAMYRGFAGILSSVAVNRLNGHNLPLSFAPVNPLPAGLSFAVSPTSTDVYQFKFIADRTTATGTYPVTIRATDGTITQDISYSIEVYDFVPAPMNRAPVSSVGSSSPYYISQYFVGNIPAGQTLDFTPQVDFYGDLLGVGQPGAWVPARQSGAAPYPQFRNGGIPTTTIFDFLPAHLSNTDCHDLLTWCIRNRANIVGQIPLANLTTLAGTALTSSQIAAAAAAGLTLSGNITYPTVIKPCVTLFLDYLIQNGIQVLGLPNQKQRQNSGAEITAVDPASPSQNPGLYWNLQLRQLAAAGFDGVNRADLPAGSEALEYNDSTWGSFGFFWYDDGFYITSDIPDLTNPAWPFKYRALNDGTHANGNGNYIRAAGYRDGFAWLLFFIVGAMVQIDNQTVMGESVTQVPAFIYGFDHWNVGNTYWPAGMNRGQYSQVSGPGSIDENGNFDAQDTPGVATVAYTVLFNGRLYAYPNDNGGFALEGTGDITIDTSNLPPPEPLEITEASIGAGGTTLSVQLNYDFKPTDDFSLMRGTEDIGLLSYVPIDDRTRLYFVETAIMEGDELTVTYIDGSTGIQSDIVREAHKAVTNGSQIACPNA